MKLSHFLRYRSQFLTNHHQTSLFIANLAHNGCGRSHVDHVAAGTYCFSSEGAKLKCRKINYKIHFLPLSPPGWRGIVVTGWAGGRAGGCQTCGTHISVTAWWIFSIRSSVELSRPVVVHRHGHLPICPKWACPWPKNLSNLVQIGSRLCGTHISETAGWIDPI